ncbi:MAG: acyloxyacyl hydrolase [Betaproteobacteria bacterium]|nr:MAG: acyloxyacyl hydrolase [Betaproteobacteria bacterium]
MHPIWLPWNRLACRCTRSHPPAAGGSRAHLRSGLTMLMLRDFPVQLNSVRSVLLTVALCVAPGALAAPFSMSDGVAVTGADGNQVKMFGFATFWNSLCACVPLKDLGFDTRLLAQLSYWRGYDESTDHRSLWEASVTPTLRWTAPGTGPVAVFAEAGVGVSALSATRINSERHFGSAFQFNEQGGLGVAFGEHRRFELAGYARHVSNGGIKQPNNGITFFGGVFRVALD